MIRKDIGAYVAIISHLRPTNVTTTTALIGSATWYVGGGESAAYAAAGAHSVIESGRLCPSRNVALRDAWALGLPCLQVSDDLKGIKLAPSGDTLGFAAAVALMRGRMADFNVKLAGCAPTANLFYYSKPVSSPAFIVGDLILVGPCSLFFDEALALKEDYDYTLQHCRRAGVVRCNDIVPNFAHRTNRGGACAARTPRLEQESIAYLKSKWPGSIRDNPRRPNEILLRF